MKTTVQAVAAAAITLIASSAADAQEAVQWRVQDGGNGHWYLVVVRTSPVEWETARLNAVSVGGHLAMAKSSLALEFIFRLTSQRPDSWIPFNTSWLGPWLGAWQAAAAPEPTGGWAWVDGSTVDLGSARADLNNSTGCGVNEDRLVFWKASSPPITPATPDFATSDLPGRGFCEPRYPAVVSFVIEWSADCNADGIVDYGQCRDGSLPDYNGNNIPDCCENGTPCVVGNYPVQWRVEDSGNGRWYQVMTYAVSPSWESARGDARSMGGDLTSFQSLAEMDFCLRLAEQRPMAWRRLPATGAWWGPWVGAFQEPGAAEPAGGWKWLDSPGLAFVSENRMTFNNQASCCGGNENRLFMYANGPAVRFEFLELNDIPETGSCQGDCSHGPMVFSSVIEWSADCNGDGIVDYGQILDGTFPDANGNGVPDCCDGGGSCTPCSGDVASDGMVDGVDLAAVLSQWGTQGSGTFNADIDGSGLVDGGDLALVLGGWGPCPQ